MRKTDSFPLKRITFDAILVAVFFVLTLFSVEVAGVKVTFDSLAVVIAAVLFGPLDAFLVGFLGAMLEQLIKYGITATTLLWVIPPAVRGLVIGVGIRKFPEGKRIGLYFVVCVIAGLVTSLLNTMVYYIDAKLYGYYNYALIFGVLLVRLLTGAAASVITAAVALPILKAIRKSGFIGERELL